MRGSLRNRLLALFLVLFVVVGAGTLYAIERTLAKDLLSAHDERLSAQGRAVASWLTMAGHVDRLTPRLAAVTGTRLTIIGADGIVQGDSHDPAAVGRAIEPAVEIDRARNGVVSRAVRQLAADAPRQYVVVVPAELGRVIRLAVPLDHVLDTRARMRHRLLVGFGFGLVGALLLSWIVVRAATRSIHAMTRTAESLAAGNYDVHPPSSATQAGGEVGVLARAMMNMAGEVKARVDELTEQRDLLSVVIGGLVEGVVVVDAGGTVVLANDAAKPLVGDVMPASLVDLVRSARGDEPLDRELELSGRTVRASARPLGGASVIVVLYDVTRMRALEAVRREFLSNAAHELRTPVTSISGYAETLLGGKVDDATAKEFLATIHRNAKRIADTVSDLLVLDTIEGRSAAISERTPIVLREVVDDAVCTARGVAAGATLHVEVDPAFSVLATREGLHHVVQNLIDNAIKYGGGTAVRIRAEPRAERIRVSVEDSGPGVPEGHEERIFERFFRVDGGRGREQGGSGLGLAIVKSHVEAMGGRVWFEHARPGARFVVELDALQSY